MAVTGAFLRKVWPILEKFPEGVHFDIDCYEDVLKFVALTQANMATVKMQFPPLVWKRKWSQTHKWWEYSAQFGDISVRIFAVMEAPARCTPIKETRTVIEHVPVEFEDREVAKEVIVGWDCHGNGEETP